MLNPADRQLLLEAVRPPEGYELHSAIATTFSLDLVALLMVPLAFTRFDYQGDDGRPNPDPLALLEAVRRHSDRLTIFCQAGEIGVPRDMHRLYTYLEDTLVEVAPPDKYGVFHPKIWALRYVGQDQSVRYRMLCLTRNLTLDRSWDALLTLEGDFRADRQSGYGRNRPLGDFIRELPSLAVRPVSQQVLQRASQMQDELRRVDFEMPPNVEDLGFWPIGLAGGTARGMGVEADRVLVVSPFLCPHRLQVLGESGRQNVLVARQDELDRIPAAELQVFKQQFVLSPLAQQEPTGEEEASPSLNLLCGLHAKAILGEYGRDAHLWIGSANATTAAVTRNVEFMVELIGKRSVIGIDRLLDWDKGETSFADLLQAYHPPDVPVQVDAVQEMLDGVVRDMRTAIATSQWELLASPGDPDSSTRYHVSLARTSKEPLIWDADRARVSTWLLSLRQDASARLLATPFAGAVEFGILSADALTGLVAFEVVASHEGREIACQFVLNVPLRGGPPDRKELVLRSLLRDKVRVLRFLLFLLASDVESLDGDLDFFATGSAVGQGKPGRAEDAPLLECLVRSLDRDPAKLDAVAGLVQTLQKSEATRNLLPEGFDEVWQAVWAARQEMLT